VDAALKTILWEQFGAAIAETAHARCRFAWAELDAFELLLHNMRHVQHRAAQLNLLLRQRTDSAPGVRRAHPTPR